MQQSFSRHGRARAGVRAPRGLGSPCPSSRRTRARPRTGRARCRCPGPRTGSPSRAAACRTRPAPPRRSRARALPPRAAPTRGRPSRTARTAPIRARPRSEIRCAHTGPTSPTFRYRAVMYGNASSLTSTSVTAAQHVARARTPEAEREQRARALGDRDALAFAELGAEPREVVLPAPAAGDDAEQLLPLARDRQVEPDPAARRERRGVDERADGPVDPVREHALEVRERVRTLHVELRERGDVEQRHAARGSRGARRPRSATRAAPPSRRAAPTARPSGTSAAFAANHCGRSHPAPTTNVAAERRPAARTTARAAASEGAPSAGAGGGCRTPRGTAASPRSSTYGGVVWYG